LFVLKQNNVAAVFIVRAAKSRIDAN